MFRGDSGGMQSNSRTTEDEISRGINLIWYAASSSEQRRQERCILDGESRATSLHEGVNDTETLSIQEARQNDGLPFTTQDIYSNSMIVLHIETKCAVTNDENTSHAPTSEPHSF